MTTPQQRSRQERALAQRREEYATYIQYGDETVPHTGRHRNEGTGNDKAAIARKDIENLKKKLGS